MKKVLALVLCLLMVAALAVSTISADEVKKIDSRELEQYGQLHFWLDAISPSAKPNSTDGKVTDGEYATMYEYSPKSDKLIVAHTDSTTNFYTDTEWVKLYMSNDGENFYVAFEVKDKAYYPDKDYFMINIGGRDAGHCLDGVSRLRYDFRGDASQGTLVNEGVTTNKSHFWKNDDGSWMSPAPAFEWTDHVGDTSLAWDEARGILTLEVVFHIQPILDYWLNEQKIEDARLYFFPIVQMRGDSAEGAADGPLDQGYLWFYFNKASDPNIKMNYVLDYPETSYWMDWEGHIIHFCEKPAETTPAPTTTAEPTTAAPTTTKAATTKAATTVAATTVADASAAATTAAEAKKGCGSTVALSALALVPMLGAAVVFGKKRED